MAKPKNTDKPAESAQPDSKTPQTPEQQLASYLVQTKTDHFNFEKPVERIYLSSGSLNLDSEGLTFPPGAYRVGGGPNLGKTPFLLNMADTLLDAVPYSRVVWFLAEGRLSDQNLARIRHPVVYDAKDWVDGSIFIFKTNTFEAAINLKRVLVTNNPTGCRYGFFWDSIDNMTLRNDLPKDISEGTKVAGVPVLSRQMWQKIGLAMRERGHWSFFISQRTAAIKIDMYAKTEARQMEGSGGNSLAHNADDSIEFKEWYESDLLLEKPDERPDRLTNKATGHVCRIRFSKSSNEKRFTVVEVPIKHGVTKGSAIWREREIADQLLGWGLVTKGGSWLTLTEVLKKELVDYGIIDAPDKVQGYNQLCGLLESRQDITNYLFAKLKGMISGGPATAVAPVAAPQ